MITVKEYFVDRDYTFSYVREDAPGNPFYHCYKLIATNNSTKVEIDTKLRIFIQPYEKIRNLNVEITNESNIKHLEKELALTKDETLDLYFPGFITNEKDRNFLSIDLSANLSIDKRLSIHFKKARIGANDGVSIILNNQATTVDYAYISELVIENNKNATISIENGCWNKQNRPCHLLKIKGVANNVFYLDKYFGRAEIESVSGSCYNDVNSTLIPQTHFRYNGDENDTYLGRFISLKNVDFEVDSNLAISNGFLTLDAPIIILERSRVTVRTPIKSPKYGNKIEHNKEILVKDMNLEIAGWLAAKSEANLEIRAYKKDIEKNLYVPLLVIEGMSVLQTNGPRVILAYFGTIKNTMMDCVDGIFLNQFYLDGAEITTLDKGLNLIGTKIIHGSIKYPVIKTSYEYTDLLTFIKYLSLENVFLKNPIFDYQTRDIRDGNDLSRVEVINKEKQIIIKAKDKKALSMINPTFVISNENDKIEVNYDGRKESAMYSGYFESCYFYGNNKVSFKDVDFAGYSLFLNSAAVVKNFARITSAQVFGAVELDGDKQN